MNEHPSQQWSALLQALEACEARQLSQDGEPAVERFKMAASQVGLDSPFDIAAMRYLYARYGKNVSYISPQEISYISHQMANTEPINPSARHFTDETKAREVQWLLDATKTHNILAMYFELAKYADGTHPLSLNSRMDHLTEVILNSHLAIKDTTVLDAFAGVGWMDEPLMRCGARTVIHVDTQEHNKLAYEELMYKRLEKPFPYIVADVFSLDPEDFRAYGVQGITAHLPWLDNPINTSYPQTDAFIRFASAVLPSDGWVVTTLDSDDIPIVQSVAQTYDFVSSQHDKTLVLQRM